MASFDQTSASRAVLIEVLQVLGAFRDEIVLVGGWVPDRLIKGFALDERRNEKDAYDIDFVLRNHRPDVESLSDRLCFWQ